MFAKCMFIKFGDGLSLFKIYIIVKISRYDITIVNDFDILVKYPISKFEIITQLKEGEQYETNNNR